MRLIPVVVVVNCGCNVINDIMCEECLLIGSLHAACPSLLLILRDCLRVCFICLLDPVSVLPQHIACGKRASIFQEFILDRSNSLLHLVKAVRLFIVILPDFLLVHLIFDGLTL